MHNEYTHALLIHIDRWGFHPDIYTAEYQDQSHKGFREKEKWSNDNAENPTSFDD